MIVPVTIYGSFPACESDTCSLRKECTNHTTAGDYRTESGVRPHLEGLNINDSGKGVMNCKSFTTANIDTEFGGVDVPFVYGECVWVDEISTQQTLF